MANKLNVLNALLKTNAYDFICISETWLKEWHTTSSIIGTSEYDMYRTDRSSKRGGGVAILIKKCLASNISLISIETSSDFEILALDYFTNQRSFTRFVCVYLPPINSTNSTVISKLCKILHNLTETATANSIYITGDFNFNDVDWTCMNSKSFNKSFAIFKDFLSKHDLSQMITSSTHLHGNSLDLFITSTPSKVLDIEIREPFASSCDHNMIEIKLNVHCKRNRSEAPKLNFYKADYTKINEFLCSQKWEMVSTDHADIDFLYSKFTDIVNEAIDRFVPVNKLRQKPKLPKAIRCLLNQKKKTYKLLKSNPALKDTYKSLEKAYKVSVKAHFTTIEDKVMRSSDKKCFYGYIKKKLHTNTQLPPLLNNNGELLLDPADKANLLNTQFSKVFLRDDNSSVELSSLFPNIINMPDVFITAEDVASSIRSLKNSVSRTPDCIPAFFLRKTSKSLAKHLANLFNVSLKLGKVPVIWKSALVVPIFKKGQKNNPGNYRPISLTSVICRILEHIIHKKITDHLIRNNLLSDIQHGFVSQRSTLTQQLNYFHDLTKLHSTKTNCDAIYIDFSKAFDRLSHRKLIFVLYHYKINNQIINWIQDLLTHRSQKTIVEGKSSQPCSITSGVPQGSVLGPLLFVLYLESLIIDIKENCTNSKIYAFADDVKLLSTDAQELQKALNIIHAWALK